MLFGLLKKRGGDNPGLTLGGDRRRRDRKPVIGELTLIPIDPTGGSGGSTEVFIRNMSQTGCGIACRIGLKPGTAVMIIARNKHGIPGAERLGTVRHCRGNPGTGFILGIGFDKPAKD